MTRTIYWFDLKTEHFYDLKLVILIFEQLKDPRDAVILKKGSTVNGLQSLQKGAVVSRQYKGALDYNVLLYARLVLLACEEPPS